jgi:alkanesulfonate monooxygenase SsuD/methylene tetrahydromethanopterin reductase-like flavin-dependent oxidoreductase (luciferase family)
MEFGYSVPSGDRGVETIRPRDFPSDMERVLAIATRAFPSVWVSDHLMFQAKYRWECWTLLTWLAARYPNTQLGTLVLCNSFRSPALLAKMAATLHTLSGGRLILGYGAGWHEEEYQAYGYDFPTPPTRVDMLEEGVQVIRALWTQTPANFAGRYYRVDNAFCEPRPDTCPTLMIGGSGEKHTLRVVARYADWWNDADLPPEMVGRKLAVLREHCQAEGRDYATLRKTLMLRVVIDRSHTTALHRAASLPYLNASALVGDASAIREQLKNLSEMGITLCQLVFTNFPETDDLRLFIDEVMSVIA